MKLTFRQGIARYQSDVYATPTFLRKSVPTGEYIDLIVSPDPTIIVFAHKGATYVVEEQRTVPNAWGPFTVGGSTKWLYWDIDLLDGTLTRGFTPVPPINSASMPANPANKTHWFDTVNHVMKVWNGSKWIEKIRVFAAEYSSTAIINPFPIGTQAGEYGSFDGGNLLLDTFGKPIRQSDGTFVTSATNLSVAGIDKVKFESEVFAGMAEEEIPKFSWVRTYRNKCLALARSDEWRSRVAGIVTEDLYESEVGELVSEGIVRNDQWDFPSEKIGRPVFCGTAGEVTLDPPRIGVLQICGTVIDTDTIKVNIQPALILDDITNEVEATDADQTMAPIADFVANTTVGIAPLTVSFTSTSVHVPILLEWDFKNKGSFDTTGERVTYLYDTPGTYAVRLRASNAYGMDEEVKPHFITVNQPPQGSLLTNLGIQLGGPGQINVGVPTNIVVMVTNDGNKGATQIKRYITVMDMGASRPVLADLPNGTTVMRANGNSTVFALPEVPSLASGDFIKLIIKVTGNVTGALRILGSVISPETDSTMSDNMTELSIKVK